MQFSIAIILCTNYLHVTNMMQYMSSHQVYRFEATSKKKKNLKTQKHGADWLEMNILFYLDKLLNFWL